MRVVKPSTLVDIAAMRAAAVSDEVEEETK
jgi:hypothetical protein